MILCCGEALIDMIEGDDAFMPHVGGAVFNTACALGRLEQKVGFVSGLSTDMFGTRLQDALHASHVDTSHMIFSDRPTTLAFVQLSGGNATYTFYDENTAGRCLDAANLPTIPDTARALYFGGISLIGMPAADFYAALAVDQADKRVIMIDPNIRPQFITNPAAYRARLAKMIAVSDILKVSDDDLNWIIDGPATLDEKAAEVLAQGPKLLLLTKGSEGAKAYLASGQTAEAKARKVDVVDTVGAGDTFNAGVLAKLSQMGCLTKQGIAKLSAEDARAALGLGVEVAAITVSRAGANPPLLSELSIPI
ncbi:fructokinase [Sulfitobacter marinus]|uniref:Fructokinase n=1 Tax=Sulfitobacter marinus TaxID=394264 RepID=A0A1I6T914_9RHOB|nr:carbohydrate kinase [Sulfitobacter marinus]SFS85725.1 fructokinase [Sulfitobacter marinus]